MGLKGKHVEFYDETLRDGVQSLWAMRIRHGMWDAVAEEIDQAGYSATSFIVVFQLSVRMGEDPWEILRMIKRKVRNTKLTSITSPGLIDIVKPYEPPAIWKLFYKKIVEATGQRRIMFMSNPIDEYKRFPEWFPFLRELELEPCPAICYYPSPHCDDKYFIDLSKKVLKFKPDLIFLKDAGGLLTVERLKGILPTMLEDAHALGIPVAIHTHGVSTNAGRVVVEAMKMGVDEVVTCCPPLANGTSHTSIFMAVHNAEVLGLTHHINLEPLKVVEQRLTAIAKQENLLIPVPLEYDHAVYLHQIPGGVLGTLKGQLSQMGIIHKLDEVLEEIPRVLEDTGNPIMITPFSQFVVTQATLNVATGERYKEIIDNWVDVALGIWGVGDSGVRYMDQNLKDKILNRPVAKERAKYWEAQKEEIAADLPLEHYKAKYGMENASDEDFITYYLMQGDEEIKRMRAAGPPKLYYTGKEPLSVLLNELKKDKDISRLELQKGNSFFDFRQS